MILCTLLDSNYIDRAIVMIDSLVTTNESFLLYVITMDEKAYNLLRSINYPNVVLVKEEDIRDQKMERLKQERSNTEYCWTCTAASILYVLEKYNEPSCTYIDADMIFYQSPNILFDEIEKSKCDISVIEHRFPNDLRKNLLLKESGKYCVQFNTFFNNENGIKALKWWKEQCINNCSLELNGDSFGDQKYIEAIVEKFSNVYSISNLGAGVAPWNISDYRLNSIEKNIIKLIYKNMISCDLIFYHFQGFRVIDDNKIYTNAYSHLGRRDSNLMTVLYNDYINRIMDARKLLTEKYGFIMAQQEKSHPVIKEKRFEKGEMISYYAKVCHDIIYGKKNIVKYNK